jgi:hypothetical protein
MAAFLNKGIGCKMARSSHGKTTSRPILPSLQAPVQESGHYARRTAKSRIVAITLRRDERLDMKKHACPGLFATI